MTARFASTFAYSGPLLDLLSGCLQVKLLALAGVRSVRRSHGKAEQ